MPSLSPEPPPAPLSRAERARRNGARSKGPVSAAGKARASRNALRHGLRARVHLVVEEEDEAAFAALSTRLLAELAPAGELEGFLVARLAALMWKTGRAERLEARALAAFAGPAAGGLELVLRYQGSVARELFRSLRELRRLRDAPLGEAPLGEAEEAGEAAFARSGGAAPAVLAAWGGPRPPADCLRLRPVPHLPATQWLRSQELADPAAAPVLVDQAGNLFARDGTPLPPHVPHEPPPPPPLLAAGPAAAPAPPAPPRFEPRHGLPLLGPGPVPAPDVPAPDPSADDAPEAALNLPQHPVDDGDANLPNEPCLAGLWQGGGAAGACTPPPRGVGDRNEPRV